MNNKTEIDKIKSCIAELVYDKVTLKKIYNYYHLTRDAEQFQHIEENYGLGTPTSVGFTPLIKKHIDVLVGEYLELDPDLQVSCKDDKTLSTIMRDKQLKINKEVFNVYKQKLENIIVQTIFENKDVNVDPFFEVELENLKKDISDSFVSEYEIAAQNILTFIKNSRDIDLKNKMRELLTDLLIGGLCYYRTKPSGSNGLKLEILNPVDTFIERNKNEFYLNKSPRAVIRRYLTKEQILLEFGEFLTKDAKEKLDKIIGSCSENKDTYINSNNSYGSNPELKNNKLLGGLEGVYSSEWSNNTITVYECEWLEYEDDKLTRHEGVQIGDEIYIVKGISKYITRSVSNPKDCSLSVNGIFLSDKNGDPFSIVMNTMDLQDRYDLTIYYRDSLIASSGSLGDWLDVAHLPEFLGSELPERVQKWLAYKKQGIALYDSSQEGAQLLNTTFNGYDDTIKAQCIQAFQLVLQSIEQQASSITGVFPEKLGDIQERDAVSNVKVGIRQSTLLTKQYFSAMDLVYKEANYDLLNLSKIVYKDGISGTLISGNKLNKIFTALPQYYTMTDFDIHIQDSSELYQEKENLKSASVELIKSQQADPAMLVNIITSRNITELKDYIEDAVKVKKQENNIISKLQQELQNSQQQLQEFDKNLKSLQEENQKLQKELQKNNAQKLEIEKRRVALEEQEIKNQKDYNDKIVKNKEKQVDLEYLQLHDNNPYNNKIKNT